MTYRFLTDSGQIVELSFEEMMARQVNGFIELEDGSLAKRLHEPEARVEKEVRVEAGREIVSDALGFPKHQLEEMQGHLTTTGQRGVEFIQDPTSPWFVQVKCDSERTKARYLKARGMVDNNTVNGSRAMLSPDLLERARQMVNERYGA